MKCGTCGESLKKNSKFCSTCGAEINYEASTNPRFARPPEKYQGPKRMYRSRSDRMIAGVCGGLGEYFEVDANLIRVIWALSILGAGFGILAYLIMVVIIPESPLDPWSE